MGESTESESICDAAQNMGTAHQEFSKGMTQSWHVRVSVTRVDTPPQDRGQAVPRTSRLFPYDVHEFLC